MTAITPKLWKNPAADCLAATPGLELSCDLPRNHAGPHFDAEYGLPFTEQPAL